MKRRRKNGTALAAAIIATPVGLAGGVYWALLSNVYHPQGGWYILGFILLGMVGPLLGLMGGMLAFGWHRSGWVLLALACVCAAALVPLSCVYAGEFRVVGEVFPIICAAVSGLAAALAFAHPPDGVPPDAEEDEEDGEDGERRGDVPRAGRARRLMFVHVLIKSALGSRAFAKPPRRALFFAILLQIFYRCGGIP